jgi:hypothetical protein
MSLFSGSLVTTEWQVLGLHVLVVRMVEKRKVYRLLVRKGGKETTRKTKM